MKKMSNMPGHVNSSFDVAIDFGKECSGRGCTLPVRERLCSFENIVVDYPPDFPLSKHVNPDA